MNRIVRKYLNDVKKRLNHLGLREREAVLDEIADHLEAEMARLRKADKGLSADEAALQATHAFGDPSDIGVAHGAGGGVVNQSTGERLLDVAILTTAATGRGIVGIFKWTGIIIGTVFLTLLLTGAFVLLVFEDTIKDGIDSATEIRFRETADFQQGYGTPSTASLTFNIEILPETRENDLTIQWVQGGTAGQVGCVVVTITDPSGDVHHNSQNCETFQQEWSFAAVGTYDVDVQLLAGSGILTVRGYALDHFEDDPPRTQG